MGAQKKKLTQNAALPTGEKKRVPFRIITLPSEAKDRSHHRHERHVGPWVVKVAPVQSLLSNEESPAFNLCYHQTAECF
jgi:hypothetical protein